ncbi:hypothetical protein SK571_39145 [Lentzea sp. BCCO 10_0798]|uniref:Dual OB-containing domain-containing protein n=1 Tax=Lentzea kristufekii TaxID=3095430 RepID=A0ABU4U4N7_9PSEU|nr:hypothetical protein [Lentzea sp. BCCO 10_0798]MDX8055427.1 hypothetical protein [Lentzea sp. BCCO 10_0798]
MKKTVVCLANSYKKSNRCIAGIEILAPGAYRWIRPVGDREGKGVSDWEMVLADGTVPRLFDVVEIDLIEHRPEGHQRENYLLNPKAMWQRIGQYPWRLVDGLPMSEEPLWPKGHGTDSGGLNCRISEETAKSQLDSLRLIYSRLVVEVAPAYTPHWAPKVWAEFRHAGQDYRLKVTDPVALSRFRRRGTGRYRLGDSLLTISLTEKYDDDHSYKIVAGIAERSPV